MSDPEKIDPAEADSQDRDDWDGDLAPETYEVPPAFREAWDALAAAEKNDPDHAG